MRILLIILLFISCAVAADEYKSQRGGMVAEIRYLAEYASDAGRRGFAQKVMQSMRKVERHEFVPESQRRHAYENRPLPIGYGQTISQPYIVALMTDLLAPQPEDVVLEIGTGSGYQAAVLSLLVRRVYSLEIIPELAQEAAERLSRLGYDNVEVHAADGYSGWVEQAPYDGIIVTAAAPHVSPYLLEQLTPGGKLVIPVGPAHGHQMLQVITKNEAGETTTRDMLPVAFVPLTRSREWARERAMEPPE